MLLNIDVQRHIASSNPKNKKSARGHKTCSSFLAWKWVLRKTYISFFVILELSKFSLPIAKPCTYTYTYRLTVHRTGNVPC